MAYYCIRQDGAGTHSPGGSGNLLSGTDFLTVVRKVKELTITGRDNDVYAGEARVGEVSDEEIEVPKPTEDYTEFDVEVPKLKEMLISAPGAEHAIYCRSGENTRIYSFTEGKSDPEGFITVEQVCDQDIIRPFVYGEDAVSGR